jgi:rRNA-processing protein FCF1
MDKTVPHVILDTNTLLHFKRPDLVNWEALLNVVEVKLVVTPALVDELEAQKTKQNASRKLKERAHNAIIWISQFIEHSEPQEISPGVRLVFIRNSPTIDFASYRLSHTVPDDQLIASAIQFKQETGLNVLFVTNDIGLRMKLPTRGLIAAAPNPGDRLPDQLDEVEKETIELRQRLERYENRLPRLKLTFRDWKSFTEIELIDPRSEPPRASHLSGAGYDLKSQAERTAKYVSEYARWRDTIRLYFPCDLIIENAGSAEASNIEVDFTLPEFISGISRDNLPERPSPPRGPFDPPELPNPAALLNLHRPRPPGKPFFSRECDAVFFEIPSLVHNRNLTLHRFYFRFRGNDSIQNFSLPYRITCTEVIDPIEDALHFKLPK